MADIIETGAEDSSVSVQPFKRVVKAVAKGCFVGSVSSKTTTAEHYIELAYDLLYCQEYSVEIPVEKLDEIVPRLEAIRRAVASLRKQKYFPQSWSLSVRETAQQAKTDARLVYHEAQNTSFDAKIIAWLKRRDALIKEEAARRAVITEECMTPGT